MTHPIMSVIKQLSNRRNVEFRHIQDLVEAMSRTGFGVSVNFVEYPLKIEREQYFNMVRNRYMSLLSLFSDDEIAKGIEEMERRFADTTILEFPDRFVFLRANR